MTLPLCRKSALFTCAAQLAAVAFMLITAPLAHAQSAYRCDEGGKPVYQATPCAGGRAITGDARSDAERNAAAAGVKNDAKLAAQLEKERKERDKTTAPGGLSSIKPAPAPVEVKTVKYVKPRTARQYRRVKTNPALVAERKPPVERKQRARLKTQ